MKKGRKEKKNKRERMIILKEVREQGTKRGKGKEKCN